MRQRSHVYYNNLFFSMLTELYKPKLMTYIMCFYMTTKTSLAASVTASFIVLLLPPAPVLLPRSTRASTHLRSLSMDTAATAAASNSPMSASVTAAPVRRPPSSNIANMNAPAATRIPPSLQAKMAAVRTPRLPTAPPARS